MIIYSVPLRWSCSQPCSDFQINYAVTVDHLPPPTGKYRGHVGRYQGNKKQQGEAAAGKVKFSKVKVLNLFLGNLKGLA